MFKRLFGMVKEIFVKVVKAESKEEVVEIVEEEQEQPTISEIKERLEQIRRMKQVEAYAQEPVQPKKRVVVEPKQMTWKQFKAYNQQVNNYLAKRTSDIA